MFPLVETIKIQEGIPQNLEYHQKRLDESYTLTYRTKCDFILKDIISVPKEFTKGKVKLRFLYNKITYNQEYHIYVPKEIKTLKIVNDNNIFYPLKYTDRACISNLLKQKQDCDDILIIKNGFITDSSYTNIVFFDGKNWITPCTPLLAGTARERLIKENKIIAKLIKTEDLNIFSSYKLINAILDFEEQECLSIDNILF